MSKKSKILIVGALVIVVLVTVSIIGFFSNTIPPKTLDLPERNDTAAQVPIMFNYGTKIVYTDDSVTDKSIFIDDCNTRGGAFNACGNACKPGTQQGCMAVCALTCEVK